MSEKNLLFQSRAKKGSKILISKYNKLTNSSLLNEIISEKKIMNIIINNKNTNISLDISSIKQIFSFNQLDINEYITLFSNKIAANKKSEKNFRKKEKEINEETTDDGEESIIKEDDYLNDNKDKNDLSLEVKRENSNVFVPDLPFINNNIINVFSSLDKVPQKYLSLIICGNKTIINIDYLKCIYPSILCCGILDLIYFVNILSTINTHLNLSFHYFLYLPLALLLIITGFYGYKKVKKNIYDNEFCFILTNICAIAPIFSFALSWIYKTEFSNWQILANFFINFISCFFSLSCIVILKEAERIKNIERDIVIHN